MSKLAYGRRIEVGILDDSESIAERILYRGNANAPTDVRDRIEQNRAEPKQTRESGVGIRHTPEGLWARRASYSVGYEPQLKSADSEPDVKRFFEVWLLLQYLRVPSGGPRQICGRVNDGAQSENQFELQLQFRISGMS